MINRLFRGLPENLDQTRREKIADMGGLEDRMSGSSGLGNFNFLGGGFGGFIPNIANIADIVAQQQGPVLGPDDFGSYVIPASDPTYSSGFDYARSIAGGMPMSQVIAPGVSYSPEQPMGYTQEQLNTAIGTTPTVSTQEPDDPSFLGTGIGGVNIPVDRKRIPFREIFGPTRDIRDLPPGTRSMFGGDPRDLPIPLSSLPRFDQAEMAENIARTMRESGMDFTNLFGIPSIKPPSLEPEAPYRLRPPIGGARPRPTLIPTEELTNSVVTGGMIPLPTGPIRGKELFAPSEEPEEPQRLRPPLTPELTPTLRPVEELIAEGFIPPQEPISVGGVGGISGPTPDIRDLILPPITSIENIAQDPRLANIPTSTPPIVPPMDLPPMDIPPIDFPPIVELPPIRGIGRPNKNRFSIQQLPRGLF
jgi:hypothetical protein